MISYLKITLKNVTSSEIVGYIFQRAETALQTYTHELIVERHMK